MQLDIPEPRLFAPTPPQPRLSPIVLVPGLDGTGKLFCTQVARLAQHFDVRCVHIPTENRQDWETLARATLAAVEAEYPHQQVYLCGESFGACLALKMASLAPRKMTRLVVINSASAMRSQPLLRWVTQIAPKVPDWLFRSASPVACSLLAAFDRMLPQQQQHFIETVRHIPKACVTWRLSMLHQFALTPAEHRTLTMPTLAIASARDRLLPSLQEAEWLRIHLPQCTTYILPNSGHVCLLESAIDLTQCLAQADFLPTPSKTWLMRR